MLRLALLATAMAYANAATSGELYTIYEIQETATGTAATTDGNAWCKGGGVVTGTTTPAFTAHAASGASHVPSTTLKGVGKWHTFVMDECYNLNASQHLPMGLPFAAGTATSMIIADTAVALSVKFTKATTTNIINLATYTNDDCETATANSPQLPRTGGGVGATAGFQCGTGVNAATSATLSTGFTVTDNTPADDAFTANGWRTANYIQLGKDTTATTTPPALQTCSTAVTNANAVSQEKAYLEVAADDDTAHPATAAVTWVNLTAAACFSDDNANTSAHKSYHAKCDLETGDLVYATYATASCAGASGAAATSVRLSQGPHGGCTDTGSSAVNWTYAAADVATLCASPASSTAAEWFTMYQKLTGTCDNTYTGATAADNIGTKAVILGVCYTNADATGSMTGMEGPFSAATTAADAKPVAMTVRTAHGAENAGGSYKFAKASGNITLANYASPDCSGTATGTKTSDDPADAAGWACGASSKLTHGGAAVTATGNDSKLQTATKFLTVRAYGDLTTGRLANTSGNCGGIAAGLQPSGQRVDHFILDQCFQSAAATSYKWKCESSQPSIANATDGAYYPISYEEFTDAACTTAAAASYQWFTQTSYNACADDTSPTSVACIATDIDDGVEFAKQTMSCGSCSTNTAMSEAACLALATPGTWTAGTCTNVNGASGEYGGKCVTKTVGAAAVSGGDDVRSMEILTDNATWNAICGVATPAPTTATSTSGAGKLAATAAAAAAAAALLL